MTDDTTEMDLSLLDAPSLYIMFEASMELGGIPIVSAPFTGIGKGAGDYFETKTVEEIGEEISKGPIFAKPFPADDGIIRAKSSVPLWRLFKDEFRLLLCTSDEKYADLRKMFPSSEKAKVAMVGTIAASVGANLGVFAGTAFPFCALCLIAILKMGKEALCKAQTLDVRASPQP